LKTFLVANFISEIDNLKSEISAPALANLQSEIYNLKSISRV